MLNFLDPIDEEDGHPPRCHRHRIAMEWEYCEEDCRGGLTGTGSYNPDDDDEVLDGGTCKACNGQTGFYVCPACRAEDESEDDIEEPV